MTIEFAKGQKVRNQYGETLTVIEQNDCMVFVAEQSTWYHPTKLFAVK